MPNYNQFQSEGATYSIDAAIKGQTPQAFYDPLKQIAYQPSVRRGNNGDIVSVLPYKDSGFWGLWSQLAAALGSDKKMVKASTFWWAEYDQFATVSFAVGKSALAIPAGGLSVTVQVSRASLSQNGVFAKPLAGYRCMIKELNRQIVDITAVQQLPNGNFNITFTPINNEVLNLTARSQYTIVLASMRNYILDSTQGTPTAEIQTRGMVLNPPALYKSYVQKFEDGFAVDESEIDNYVYNKEFFIIKGLNMRGEKVDYFYIPQLSVQAEEMIIANRNFQTLFAQRDNVHNLNFDGVIPTIEKYGMFNYAYDIFLGGSFKSLLFSIIKSLRKINGSNEYMICHDFNFGLDWSEAIASLVKMYQQNYQFKLFGEGGMGEQDFEYFNFRNFSWSSYMFKAYQIDMFDSYRYGRPFDYSALLIPAKAYSDTDGNRVPIMNYVNIEGAEPAKDQSVWIDDARVRAQRNLRVFFKDSFGIEIHKPTQLGMLWRGKNTAE
jgi:hypothetical protein